LTPVFRPDDCYLVNGHVPSRVTLILLSGGGMPGVGIASYATHIPYWRLQRATIDAALGGRPGTGSRAVAAFDEDTTTMAVEAGRAALAGWSAPGSVDGRTRPTPPPSMPRWGWVGTRTPPT